MEKLIYLFIFKTDRILKKIYEFGKNNIQKIIFEQDGEKTNTLKWNLNLLNKIFWYNKWSQNPPNYSYHASS